jgi:hypothetical protein
VVTPFLYFCPALMFVIILSLLTSLSHPPLLSCLCELPRVHRFHLLLCSLALLHRLAVQPLGSNHPGEEALASLLLCGFRTTFSMFGDTIDRAGLICWLPHTCFSGILNFCYPSASQIECI